MSEIFSIWFFPRSDKATGGPNLRRRKSLNVQHPTANHPAGKVEEVEKVEIVDDQE
jgi:hypothetical protein